MRTFFLRHGGPLYFAMKSFCFGLSRGEVSEWLGSLLGGTSAEQTASKISKQPSVSHHDEDEGTTNPLREFFNGNIQGPRIWKWQHYFEMYHRHLERLRGQEVHIV